MGPNPQGQMPQATRGLAVAIDRPGAGLQVGLERFDQGIEAGIQHRTVVHVHNPMAAAQVVAAAQAAVRATLQWNHRPIAVAETTGRLQQRQ